MSGGVIIASAAHIKVCQCPLQEDFPHAWIVLADGREGPVAFSRRELLDTLTGAVESSLVFTDEVPELKRQILKSGLPQETSPMVAMARTLSSEQEESPTIEEMRRTGIESYFLYPAGEVPLRH